MTSYQADPETVATQSLSSNEMINELIRKRPASHVEVIQTVIASLEQDGERDGQPNRGKLCLEV